MSSTYGKVFGGIVAVILLLLYVVAMAFLVTHVVICKGNANCVEPFTITTGMTLILTTIGGMVSALVVATLAITEPGDSPSGRWINMEASAGKKKAVNYLVWIYLAVWVVTGLTALIVGVMLYPDANQTLSDVGTTWLGVAVAAAYAYFGLKPKA
jgi:hypothetical protein